MENISKYLEDKRFIQWVFGNGPELEEWWKNFETENPLERQNIQSARCILQKLQTRNHELSEDDKIILFTKIIKQVEERQKNGRMNVMFVTSMKYAAVAILFFAIGALFFYRKDNFNREFFTQDISEPVHSDARIIRPGGEDIILHGKNSKIEYRPDGHVVVNDQVQETSSAARKGNPAMNQLVIPYGKTSELLLPDGSRVWLNAGSRLIYPEYFTDKTREVLLIGEAFFDVEHHEKQPFIVQTSDIRIKVLGTRFNVSAYPSDPVIETVLTHGKISLEQHNSRIFKELTELKPGQLAIYNRTEGTTLLREVDIENHSLWKEGLLKFESTDLNRLTKRLERYFNIRFNFSDPMLGTIRISGKLELSDSRDSVLENVADAASVSITRIGENSYTISH
jgi:transmembrane sensor